MSPAGACGRAVGCGRVRDRQLETGLEAVLQGASLCADRHVGGLEERLGLIQIAVQERPGRAHAGIDPHHDHCQGGAHDVEGGRHHRDDELHDQADALAEALPGFGRLLEVAAHDLQGLRHLRDQAGGQPGTETFALGLQELEVVVHLRGGLRQTAVDQDAQLAGALDDRAEPFVGQRGHRGHEVRAGPPEDVHRRLGLLDRRRQRGDPLGEQLEDLDRVLALEVGQGEAEVTQRGGGLGVSCGRLADELVLLGQGGAHLLQARGGRAGEHVQSGQVLGRGADLLAELVDLVGRVHRGPDPLLELADPERDPEAAQAARRSTPGRGSGPGSRATAWPRPSRLRPGPS